MVNVDEKGFMSLTNEERAEANRKRGQEIKTRNIITYEKPRKEISPEEIMGELMKLKEIPEGEELKCLRTRPDLLIIWLAIIENPIERFGKLELPERMKKQPGRKGAYNQLDKLEEVKLIERISIQEVWEKHISSKKLSKEEKEVLRKWKIWEKNLDTKKAKKHFKEISHYFNPIGKSKDPQFLRMVISSVQEERKKSVV